MVDGCMVTKQKQALGKARSVFTSNLAARNRHVIMTRFTWNGAVVVGAEKKYCENAGSECDDNQPTSYFFKTVTSSVWENLRKIITATAVASTGLLGEGGREVVSMVVGGRRPGGDEGTRSDKGARTVAIDSQRKRGGRQPSQASSVPCRRTGAVRLREWR